MAMLFCPFDRKNKALLSIHELNNIKTFWLRWHSLSNSFSFIVCIEPLNNDFLTKRQILFDILKPVEWLQPCTFIVKILSNNYWRLGTQLSTLEEISIPRWLSHPNPPILQTHLKIFMQRSFAYANGSHNENSFSDSSHPNQGWFFKNTINTVPS